MFTESEFNVTVVIVGAGPTGLTLAVDLARRGVSHRIVERSAHPFDGSRGKGLQPRTQEVLEDLGVLDRFQRFGGAYPALRVHRPDGKEIEWRMDELHDPTPAVPYPNVLMIPQWRTGELLAHRLAELGGRVELGVEVTGLTHDERGVHVALGDGETITARYVVGADGGRSVIRRALGVGFEGETFETQRMLIADVRLTGLDRDRWHIWPGAVENSIRLGLCPLPGTEDFQLTAPLIDDEGPAPTLESLQRLVDECVPGVTLTHLGWSSLFRANTRMADRYRVGNVFLAGDAAHVHSPAGGQGLNTGIQDAYNLGWKLAMGDDALLDTYEAERLPVAAAVLGISTRLHNRHAERAEDAIRRDDPVLRQLSLSYRGGPLAVDRRKEPGSVTAGDRVPDADCHDATGTPIRIFEVLRGPHATLLAFDVDPDTELPASTDSLQVRRVVRPGVAAGADAIVDTNGHAHEAYDIKTPTLLLVRPDGHVGCAADDLAAITEYLKSISLATSVPTSGE
jgi:2-polyprenyl-6-methoxyphenol hydroxylase-like FAD-dependent oxidoreductase